MTLTLTLLPNHPVALATSGTIKRRIVDKVASQSNHLTRRHPVVMHERCGPSAVVATRIVSQELTPERLPSRRLVLRQGVGTSVSSAQGIQAIAGRLLVLVPFTVLKVGPGSLGATNVPAGIVILAVHDSNLTRPRSNGGGVANTRAPSSARACPLKFFATVKSKWTHGGKNDAS